MVWETRQVCEEMNYRSPSLTRPLPPANDDANTLGHNAAPFAPPLCTSKRAQTAQLLQLYCPSYHLRIMNRDHPGQAPAHAHPCSLCH